MVRLSQSSSGQWKDHRYIFKIFQFLALVFDILLTLFLITQELVFPKSAHGTSSLYLDRVMTQHAGRLTCVAVSAAGSALHTATLQVSILVYCNFNSVL